MGEWCTEHHGKVSHITFSVQLLLEYLILFVCWICLALCCVVNQALGGSLVCFKCSYWKLWTIPSFLLTYLPVLLSSYLLHLTYTLPVSLVITPPPSRVVWIDSGLPIVHHVSSKCRRDHVVVCTRCHCKRSMSTGGKHGPHGQAIPRQVHASI